MKYVSISDLPDSSLISLFYNAARSVFLKYICVYAAMFAAAAAAKSLQSCLTLCDPIDGSPPGFSVHGILQARVLEWDAIAFSAAMFIYIYISMSLFLF